jgi:hypothetical protein
MLLSPQHARQALAAIRIVNGAAALVAPRFMLRRLGVDPRVEPSGVYPFRMFGIRTVLIGADLLVLSGAELRRADQFAVLIHATDTVSAATTGFTHALPRRAAITATLVSATNTALAVVALKG